MYKKKDYKMILIIPALNEENNISNVIQGVQHAFPNIDIVVINDGSTDKTKELAEKQGAVVLSHVMCMGYGVAVQTGYKYAFEKGYDYIIQLDADGQHNHKDISQLLQPLLDQEADLVIGSRFLNKDNQYKMQFARKIGVFFFRGLMKIFTGVVVKDITSGMQAFNTKVLEKYVSDIFPCYYPDVNMLIFVLKNNLKIKEVPVTMQRNKENKSMHKGLRKQIYYIVSMLLSILVIICKGLEEPNAD